MATARAQGGLRESDGFSFFLIFFWPWKKVNFPSRRIRWPTEILPGPGARSKKVTGPWGSCLTPYGGMQNEPILGHLLQDFSD